MAEERDTEITLGTGKLLALFFGIVLTWALFFGMGFTMGKGSVQSVAPADAPSAPLTTSPHGPKPSATGETLPPSPEAIEANPTPAQNESAAAPESTRSSQSVADGGKARTSNNPEISPAPAPALKPPVNSSGPTVQVAAVSKQADADSLVEELRRKNYPVFVLHDRADPLFHVQVGPFSDVNEAEAMRARLAKDGYGGIVKK